MKVLDSIWEISVYMLLLVKIMKTAIQFMMGVASAAPRNRANCSELRIDASPLVEAQSREQAAKPLGAFLFQVVTNWHVNRKP